MKGKTIKKRKKIKEKVWWIDHIPRNKKKQDTYEKEEKRQQKKESEVN